MTTPSLQERFDGRLLGVSLGDAIGAKFEAQSPAHIHERIPSPEALAEYCLGLDYGRWVVGDFCDCPGGT